MSGTFEEKVDRLFDRAVAAGKIVSKKDTYSPQTVEDALNDLDDARASLLRHIYGEGDLAKDLFTKIQESFDRMLTPIYPRILVRVLGKEQVVGGIILPEEGTANATQNKPLWEGVVLDTYKPFIREVKLDGEWQELRFTPVVKEGDHVLFSHWVGVTGVVAYNDNWRFIPENEIQGVLEYEKRPGELITSRTTSGGMR